MSVWAGPNVTCAFAKDVVAHYKANPSQLSFKVKSATTGTLIGITAHPADGASFTTEFGSTITYAPAGL